MTIFFIVYGKVQMPERKEKILTHFKHTCHERKKYWRITKSNNIVLFRLIMIIIVVLVVVVLFLLQLLPVLKSILPDRIHWLLLWFTRSSNNVREHVYYGFCNHVTDFESKDNVVTNHHQDYMQEIIITITIHYKLFVYFGHFDGSCFF